MRSVIEVKVQPRSSRQKAELLENGTYKVYTHKPAADGEANQAVIEILAEHLGVKKTGIRIIKGGKSRNKLIEVNT